MPTISVIVPVYNVEKYIHRCVDSILAQAFTDFELILVDDGSPDNCGAICDEYAGKDSRVRVIHQENGGLSAARNAGIDWAFANSDSRWLSFVDSDDWVHPQYLEFLHRAAVEGEVPLSTCAFSLVKSEEYADMSKAAFHYEVMPSEDIYTETGAGISAYACGRLYQKTFWQDIRFPKGRLWEDTATTYKVVLSIPRSAKVSQPLYFYYYNPNGIVFSEWKPSKMDSLWAMETQLADQLIQKHRMVYAIVQEKYVLALSSQIIAAGSSENLSAADRKKYCFTMRKKLKRALWQFRRNPNIKFKNNKWSYEQAYPKIMWCYWTIAAQVDKLFRRKKSEKATNEKETTSI